MDSEPAAASTGSEAGASAAFEAGTKPADHADHAAQRTAGRAATLTIENLRYDVLRNAAYHAARQAYFSGLYRGSLFITALSGTATISAALTEWKQAGAIAGIVTTVAAVLDLVFQLGERSAFHARMRERVFHLLAEAEEADASQRSLRKCFAALTRLYGEEPPTMKAVEACAWNAAKAATTRDLDKDDLLIVPWYWHYPLRHILPFSGSVFCTRREKRKMGTWWSRLRGRPTKSGNTN
jgi:hypothetical protein